MRTRSTTGFTARSRARRFGTILLGFVLLFPLTGVGSASAAPVPDHVSIDDVSVVEGDAGTVDAVFTIRRSDASNGTAWVDYATSDATATATSDYAATQGTAKFLGNRREVTISVPVHADVIGEVDETFRVVLSNPQHVGVLDDAVGVGTIVDDDGVVPSLVFVDQRAAEGDPAGDPAVGVTRKTSFTVQISQPTTVPVSFTVVPNGGFAGCQNSHYRATEYDDFGILDADRNVTIAPGETTATVPLQLWADTVVEPDEDFFVSFKNLQNVSVIYEACNVQKFTIVNDDLPPPSLVFVDQSTIEGDPTDPDAPNARRTSVTVQISAPTTRVVSFTLTTGVGGTCRATHSPAELYFDYAIPEASRQVTLQPGQTTATVPLDIWADTVIEPDEDFYIGFTDLKNVAVVYENCNVQKFTIRNDDLPPPSLVFVAQSELEGNPPGEIDGARRTSITVRISAPTTRVVSFRVGYNSEPSVCRQSLYPATHLHDFGIPEATQLVTILPGATTATVPLEIWADRSVEPDEEFFVTFSELRNVTVVPENCNVQKFTIVNDD